MKLQSFILITAIFLSSCTKEPIDDPYQNQYPAPYHSKISSLLYPYLFNTGSYWIYRDTSTNSEDSIALVNVRKGEFMIGPSHPGQGPQGYAEYFDMTYYSSDLLTTYREQLLGYIISRGFTYGGWIYLGDRVVGNKAQNAEITDILDSMIIENNIYRKVVKMSITKDQYIADDYHFYFADSIGIIKKEKLVNDTIVETQNLVRRNVIMRSYP